MAPYTQKAKVMKKSELVNELNKLFAANEALQAQLNNIGKQAKTERSEIKREIKSGIDDLSKSIEENFNIGQAVAALMSGEALSERVKTLAIKGVIAFCYGYTLGVAGSSIATAITLLTLPAWLTFVVNVAIITALVWFAMGTMGPVTNVVYNGAGSIRQFLSREFKGAKEWVEKATNDVREQHAKRMALREAALATQQ